MKIKNKLMKVLSISLSIGFLSVYCAAADVEEVIENTVKMGGAKATVTLPAGKKISSPSQCSISLDDDGNYPSLGVSKVNTIDTPSADCECPVGAESFVCTIPEIEVGTYFMTSVIFVNQEGGSSPAEGDFIGYYGSADGVKPTAGNFEILADVVQDVKISLFVIPQDEEAPAPTTVTATINLPVDKIITAPAYCYASLDNDTDTMTTGVIDSVGVSTTSTPSDACDCTIGASSYTCTFTNVKLGYYFVHSLVYNNSHSPRQPATGDFRGYHGTNSDTKPTDATLTTIVAGQDNPVTIQQVVYTAAN
ncbi:MAG: hypothetical protein OEZ22_01005 [Spirochaetia bacterium]|nr:hypothetical protein [Spirochaetia bacterium]